MEDVSPIAYSLLFSIMMWCELRPIASRRAGLLVHLICSVGMLGVAFGGVELPLDRSISNALTAASAIVAATLFILLVRKWIKEA